MRFDTYIFDLDGTLLNSLDDLASSCNYALRQHGMGERSLDEVRQFVGNGVKRLIERATPEGTSEAEVQSVLATFKQHYSEHNLDRTRPYDGINSMLAALKNAGCRLAVVSNKFCSATEALVNHFFSDTISVAIGENEAAGIRKKPAPDTVEEALRRLGVGKQRAVYVGDSDTDILTAKNSGIPCISVLWGFRDRDFLVSHGAQTLVSEPMQLLEV